MPPEPTRVWTFLTAYKRDGSIKGFAMVDHEDYEWAKEYRWHINTSGYFYRDRTVDGKRRPIRLHREIMGLENGDPIEIDHRNRDRLDNRRCNLRYATRKQNGQNLSLHSTNTSGYRGVYYDKRGRKKWYARVMVDGRFHHLGYFMTELEAGQATAAFRAKHMPYSAEAG